MLDKIIKQLRSKKQKPDSAQSFLLEHLPHVVFELDSEYRWVLLNEAWEQLTGLSRDACIGESCNQYFHPEDRDQVRGYLQSLQPRQTNNQTIEARVVLTQTGVLRRVEISALLVVAPDGQPLRIGSMTDITERVAEEERLHTNNRSLSGLLNDLSGMMYRCRNDRNWTMEYISSGCKELTGCPPADIVDNFKLSWDSLIHSEDRDMVWAEVQSGLRDSHYFDITYRMFTIEGKRKWVWERGKGIFSADGELLGLEGYITDITAEKLRNERLLNDILYDSQTGLIQLPLFWDRLSRAIERYQTSQHNQFSLLVIQLHKLIDTFEHSDDEFGKQITLDLSNRITKVIDNSDSITSLKPDRYAILIERPHDRDGIEAIAQKILETMRTPIQAVEKTLFITCSIGCSNGKGINDTVDSLMHNAITAMDQAGAQGGSRFEFYDPEMTTRI
jgi:PAS domain S-box-containing protein